MYPPAVDPAADIRVNCTYGEIIIHFEKMMSGSPPPGNVMTGVNPYIFEPSNLPDGIWYLNFAKESIDTEHGLWKAKGVACEVFSNSCIIGWMTTLEFYEGQVPHEHKTDWVMQEFSITDKSQSENTKEREAGSLGRVFLGSRQSPNHEMQQNTFNADTSRGTQSQPTQLIFPNAGNNSRQGSTSEPQANKDDKTGEVAVTERLPIHHEENQPEIEGDYLELLDLVNHASPSSSSESSSGLTMSSDECFDSLALLQDLDSENNQDLVQKDAGYKFTVSAPNEVVISPAISESRISIRRSESPTEEILKTDCSVPGSVTGNRNLDNKVLKHVVRSQKADYRDEGPSSDHHNLATSSRGHKTARDGEKKAAVGRMKKLRKKYFCFIPF